MRALLKNQSLSYVALTTLLAIGAAGVQFVALSLVNRFLPRELASQVAFLASLFPTWLMLVDLHLSAEQLRRMTHDGKSFAESVWDILPIRLVGSLLAVATLASWAFFSLSSFAFLGVLALSLAYPPLALLVSIESLGYVQRRLIWSMAWRGMRLFAFPALLAALWLLKPYGEWALPGAFLAFSGAFWLGARYFYKKICASEGFVWPLRRSLWRQLPKAILDLHPFLLGVLFSWGFFAVFNARNLVTQGGETEMLNYTSAANLGSPAAILVQVAIGTLVGQRGQGKKKILGAMLLALSLWAAVVAQGDFVRMAFPKSDPNIVLWHFLGHLTYQILAGVTFALQVEARRRGVQTGVWVGAAAALVLVYPLLRFLGAIPEATSLTMALAWGMGVALQAALVFKAPKGSDSNMEGIPS